MGVDNIESGLVEHCAPTLAGMKSAGLFNYFYNGKQDVLRQIEDVNRILNEKGVYVRVLLWRDKSALIYAYRPAMLSRELNQPGVCGLLKMYGYDNCDVNYCLDKLKTRLSHYSCFPHEIGIFLGYPLEDVVGFIENDGKNCETCGTWKVYCNREEKEKLFCKFKKCQDVYLKIFGTGRKLSQLTVCS